ncbi:MAG: glutamine-hydrolyzing carbamoyl-phosphate synthase small subunit [Candidatus Micrarchaeota archaeon]|nr:glutamine-hydrolyzing carbamoyl-phosphate synthase small subunit [Candidatus Micrarchaeota archaeon]
MPDKAYIYLEDGTVLEGEGFGSRTTRTGELVFTTAMNGYPESLTDPSYEGNILIMTHPLIGNYGVPAKKQSSGILSNFESERIHAEALVIGELTKGNKWNSSMGLDEWLSSEGVPGIQGIDTRMLTKTVRNKGAMMCTVSTQGKLKDPKRALDDKYTNINFVERVSPKKPLVHGSGKRNVVVVDCGVKHGILQCIAEMGYKVTRMPYDSSADDIMKEDPAGIVYSNGPGNPNLLDKTVESFRNVMEYKVPIFGICLGNQVASLAMGGRVRKMKFGHRAINKGVIDIISKRAYITTHNHGYAMLPEDVPEKARVWLLSKDDNVVEGMMLKENNIITTQFHPEARPGTNDARFMFGMFDRMMKEYK